MRLIFIHGLPGVGKLTVARELAGRTGYRLFHNHLAVDLVGSVFEFGSEPFVELREAIWLAVFARAARERVGGLVFTFVFERTVSEGFVGRVLGEVEGRGGEVHFVELACDRAELSRRLTDPSREKFGKLRSVEFFDELLASGALQSPSPPRAGLRIDVTSLPPADAAARIAAHYGLPASARPA